MIEADSDNFAILAMGVVDPGELLALTSSKSKPDVTKLGDEGPR
jgi:hypothetical protein